MQRRHRIILLILPVALLLLIFLSMYGLNIYGDVIVKHPASLFADTTSRIKVEVVPVNAFGWKIPFRKSRSEFILIEGQLLVKVVEINSESGFIILEAKGIPGIVEIQV